MTALQFAIGALNDVVDAPADAARIPPKPIPSGRVTRGGAMSVVVAAVLLGLALAFPDGPGLIGIAILGLAIGAAYDLVAKGTVWSWVPFAVGIPLLPVYGWFGATGTLPDPFRVLLPMAALAGAGLAIANARADLEADRAAGTRSVATALGPAVAWRLNVALIITATAIGYAYAGPPGVNLFWFAVQLGTIVAAAALGQGRNPDQATWRGAWQIQAIGVAVAGVGWAGVVLS